MKIKEVTIGKKMLVNIGNYSNVEISHSMTVEIAENEIPDYDAIYDEINHQLQIETEGLDPRWVKNDYDEGVKLTITLPKRNGKEKNGN